MILKVFAARDMKAEAFLQPYYSPNVGSAVRAFGDACNEKNSPFNKHPNDYVLYEIATYDDNTAEFISLNPIKMLGCAADFIVRDMPQGGPGLKLSEMHEMAEEIQNGKK